jgi:drug/metabolite transporter (DMT)-like permease
MTSWYGLSIAALFLMGAQRFLYKVSAERNCNTALTTFSFMGTVTLLALIIFLVQESPVGDVKLLLIIALLNSCSFFVGTVTHIEALKHIPTTVAYPIIRLNAVVVVLFSILFFKDSLSLTQGLGIILAILVMLILAGQTETPERASKNMKRGLVLVFIALVAGSAASISSKFAAMYTNRIAFMTLSYFMGTLFSFGLRRNLATKGESAGHREALVIGVIMGLINFAGFYAFLKALSLGPLSIIVSITGLHFVIAIILSVVVYRERLTSLRILGVILTIVSVLLLRL